MNNRFIFWGVNGYLHTKNELPVKKWLFMHPDIVSFIWGMQSITEIYSQSIYLCLQTLHGHDNLLWLISRSNDCIGVNTQNILMTKIAVETPVLQFMM